jgi:hypothetical protein
MLENRLELINNPNSNNIKEDFQKIIENKDKRIKELEDKLNFEEKTVNIVVFLLNSS